MLLLKCGGTSVAGSISSFIITHRQRLDLLSYINRSSRTANDFPECRNANALAYPINAT
jgi:hypothetical protein